MALVKQEAWISSKCGVVFTYDDTTMKLVSVSSQNDSDLKLKVELLDSGLASSTTINSKDANEATIDQAKEQPVLKWDSLIKGHDEWRRIAGLKWRMQLG